MALKGRTLPLDFNRANGRSRRNPAGTWGTPTWPVLPPKLPLITQGYAGIVTYRSDTNGSSGGPDRISIPVVDDGLM